MTTTTHGTIQVQSIRKGRSWKHSSGYGRTGCNYTVYSFTRVDTGDLLIASHILGREVVPTSAEEARALAIELNAALFGG